MSQKIAFIGATGMIGLPVAKALASKGFHLTALVRDTKKAEKLLPTTITLIQGDLRNTHDIETLLQGNSILYLNLNLKQNEKPSDFHAEAEGLQNVLEVAKRKGIQRIAFVSSMVMNYQGMNGFHWWVFDIKHNAVQMIKASGIPYTIFYLSTLMENFHGNYRMGNRLLLAGKSLHKMHFFSAIDFSEQVVRSFELVRSENKEYFIQGLEGFTADEAALEFQRYYTKEKLHIATAPLGILKFFGRFSQKLNYGANIIEALNNYPEKFEAEQTWQELGKPTITLRDFAQF